MNENVHFYAKRIDVNDDIKHLKQFIGSIFSYLVIKLFGIFNTWCNI